MHLTWDHPTWEAVRVALERSGNKEPYHSDEDYAKLGPGGLNDLDP